MRDRGFYVGRTVSLLAALVTLHASPPDPWLLLLAQLSDDESLP